jgi:hypothetical protein
MYDDALTLEKKSTGERIEGIIASIKHDAIMTQNDNFSMTAGDVLIRAHPNGSEERFKISQCWYAFPTDDSPGSYMAYVRRLPIEWPGTIEEALRALEKIAEDIPEAHKGREHLRAILNPRALLAQGEDHHGR